MTNNLIEPPLFAYEGDLSVFETVKSAEGYLEVYDIDVYQVYDSKGRRLKLLNQDDRVKVVIHPDGGFFAEELRIIIIDYLIACGEESQSIKKSSLPQLLEKSLLYKCE